MELMKLIKNFWTNVRVAGFFTCRCILGASTEVPGRGSFPISANVRLPGVWGVVDTEFQALAGLLPGTVLQNLGGTRAVWRLAKLDKLIEQTRTEGGSSMLFMFWDDSFHDVLFYGVFSHLFLTLFS